jgi:thiol-disulfide isomerase/thioredoxin
MSFVTRRGLLYGGVVLAAFGGGAWLGLSRFASPPPQPGAAEAIKALDLRDIDGKSQNFQQWQGKVVVVNFWATWCAPCREEIPIFVKMQEAWGSKGLQFVGIAIDDVSKTRDFAANFKINYPTLMGGFDTIDITQKAGNKLRGLPFTVIIDRKGGIAATELGGVTREKLEAIVSLLL